ncbi:ATP-binding protein [Nocardiopsis sp. RSe5-2]|uniref:Oxygen sensor histidine kinase NreB n=1 Tax=Nocardiopsis endophytica TaxID=3018445 RepID=A0ABT4U7Q1_9ACTN|nr:ATP-binding protein [Nocardiopsis endophytica]MDA2812985.1 ATP-binding protein [Nocardiopsis endophytica]
MIPLPVRKDRNLSLPDASAPALDPRCAPTPIAEQELHDRVGPELAVAARRLELFALYRHSEPSRAESHLTGAQASVGRCLDDIARILRCGRPEARPLDLARELEEYAETVDTRGTAVSVRVRGEAALPLELRSELYLMVREALRNALRHARARTVRVVVEVRGGRVNALVDDDGTGFGHAEAARGDGLGLASLRERARRLGGRTVVDTAPGDGTRVLIRLPLTPGTAHGTR